MSDVGLILGNRFNLDLGLKSTYYLYGGQWEYFYRNNLN